MENWCTKQISPVGATWSSPGRKPWERMNKHAEPRRGGMDPGCRLIHATRFAGSVLLLVSPQGLRPGLLYTAPLRGLSPNRGLGPNPNVKPFTLSG